MQTDKELMALCELSREELEVLLSDESNSLSGNAPSVNSASVNLGNPERDAETRMLSYLHDLREVLRMESGAGIRVLRMWLDEACMNSRLGRDEYMREQVALQEFARDRMADVALADPVCHVRLQLQFSREWAGASAEQ